MPGGTVRLEQFVDDRWGFLRVHVTRTALKCEYFTVPGAAEGAWLQARLADSFVLDLGSHRLKTVAKVRATRRA